MRRLSVACLVAMANCGTATAQYLNAPTSLTRIEARPASIMVEASSRATYPAVAGSRVLERLPIDRLQRLLKTNVPLRVAETAVGAAILSVHCRRTAADSTIGHIGVHALRFGGADWLERSRFRIEPQIVRGGFAVYVKKNN